MIEQLLRILILQMLSRDWIARHLNMNDTQNFNRISWDKYKADNLMWLTIEADDWKKAEKESNI